MLTSTRHTKYVQVVYDTLNRLGHSTNLELLNEARKQYPEVSATTIHRVTSRLHSRNLIGQAPKLRSGAERYDINPVPHHHFSCSECDRLCDVPKTRIANEIIEQLQTLSSECVFVSTLTLSGVCKQCANDTSKKENV